MTKVVTAAATIIAAPSAARRRKGVVIRDLEETATPSTIVHSEPKSKDKGKEDLEMLWQIFQERFASSKLKNFSDKFLLTTLKAMFEKHDVEAHIWKNQRVIHGLPKVKSWKFFGVDAVEDFKEYALRDYYCWYKLKLLDNAADSRLRLLEQSVAADDKMKK
nr:hypothetical protein [Tanacetum cinerariifolium]